MKQYNNEYEFEILNFQRKTSNFLFFRPFRASSLNFLINTDQYRNTENTDQYPTPVNTQHRNTHQHPTPINTQHPSTPINTQHRSTPNTETPINTQHPSTPNTENTDQHPTPKNTQYRKIPSNTRCCRSLQWNKQCPVCTSCLAQSVFSYSSILHCSQLIMMRRTHLKSIYFFRYSCC